MTPQRETLATFHRPLALTLCLTALTGCGEPLTDPAADPWTHGGAERPRDGMGSTRVWVTTDLRQFGDPDDKVAFSFFMVMANFFDVEGFVVGATDDDSNATLDAAQWVTDNLLPAYLAEKPNLEAVYGPYPDIPIIQAATGGSTFDPGNTYDLGQYPSVQAAKDALQQGPLWFLVWGRQTEAAVLVDHLLETGQTTLLDNLNIVGHATLASPNCSGDQQACDFLHDRAAEGAVKFWELGPSGNSGLNSSACVDVNVDRNAITQGQIGALWDYKWKNGRQVPDGSDAVTFLFLPPLHYGGGSGSFPPDGVKGPDVKNAFRCDRGEIFGILEERTIAARTGAGGGGPVCGDGAVDPGEQCDDGNTVTESCAYGQPSCTVCDAQCQDAAGATSYCGDGVVDGSEGEQCDDGNTTDADGCSATCLLEGGDSVCGDGVVDPGEQCDDGNTTTGDGCSATCLLEGGGPMLVDDAFERPDGPTLGAGWVELETGGEVSLVGGEAAFTTTDAQYSPILSRTFPAQSTGVLTWSFDMDFARTSAEGTYEVFFQLGSGMSEQSDSEGVAVSLRWGDAKDGFTSHEGFGYVDASGNDVQVITISGLAHVEVTVDIATQTYDLRVDGIEVAQGVPFRQPLPALTQMRFVMHQVGNNVQPKRIDDVVLSVLDP